MIRIQSRHEKLFQDRLIREFHEEGAEARHWEPEVSAPDLYVFRGDRYVMMELKSIVKPTRAKFHTLFQEGQLSWIARHIGFGMNVMAAIECRELKSVILFNPRAAREVEEAFDLSLTEIRDIYPLVPTDILVRKMVHDWA